VVGAQAHDERVTAPGKPAKRGPVQVPYELFLAVRYLRFHRGRTFLSVITLISTAGMIVGTAALVIALSLMAGFVDDVRRRIYSGSAHLTLMSVDQARFDDAERLIHTTLSVRGVRHAAPVLYTPAMLTLADLGSPSYAEVHAIDPVEHAGVILDAPSETNPFEPLSASTHSGRDGIVLGKNLALRMGVVRGDLVQVLAPQVTLTPWAPVPRSRVFEVVGTYQSDHFQEDSLRAYVGLPAARKLLRAQGKVSWVEVRLDDLRQLEPMKNRLGEELGPAWLVVDLIEQNQDLFKALNTEKLALFLAIGLIVAVAALNIVSTLILMVTDKVKEIGTLSAMGARPRGIAVVFMLQGIVIGVVGAATGLLLGSSVVTWLDRYRLIQLNPDVYYLSYLPFLLRPLDLAFVGGIALLISFLATIYPAFKAARLDPVEAIRHE